MRRRRQYKVITISLVVVSLTLYSAMMIMPAMAYDFHIFYAAARVLHDGGNPYDIHQVFHQEQHLYPHLMRNTWQRMQIQQSPYVQGPLLLIALLPGLHWPPATIYPIYFGVLAAATVASLVLLSRLWPLQQSRKWALFLLLSPIAFLGPYLGQVDALLVLAFVLALWCMTRQRYTYSGAILMVGLIKPQIMLGPILLLAVIAWRHRKLAPYGAGLLLGVMANVAFTLLAAKPTLLTTWLASMARFTKGTVYAQDDISSLTSLYIRWMPHSADTVLSIGVIALWCGVCAWLWPRVRTEATERWWLSLGLVGWLLATPYAHPHDDVLLLPAMWLLFSNLPTGRRAHVIMTGLFVSWWSLPLAYVLWGARADVLASRGLGVVPILLLALVLAMQYPNALTRPRSTHADIAGVAYGHA
jgi:Glycosyltransferase family 87